jgi:aflatoxin B1 aldehyde reductase
MDTKFFPNVTGFFGRAETHSNKADMQKSLTESLTALGAEGVDLWYLHAPDRTVPLEETARAVHELMREGGGSRFKRWGVSNFMAWEGMCALFYSISISSLFYCFVVWRYHANS